ncbi:DoxX family protein [Mesorhizobium sp. ASY16-5R]|uniref:DoxX family protein n=1 Tax=Mesorhizobium sp. ASY16-5R TaxID=3445772 RepID=UPI003F9F676F
MQMFEGLSKYQSQFLAVLRIVTALLYIEHGTMKLFGFPASSMAPGDGGLSTLMLVAGILETFGGLLIVVGFHTRTAAFILSGQMAVAYFKAHAPQDFFPANNMGDAAILFCFIFLYLVFAGPGAWSVDGARR